MISSVLWARRASPAPAAAMGDAGPLQKPQLGSLCLGGFRKGAGLKNFLNSDSSTGPLCAARGGTPSRWGALGGRCFAPARMLLRPTCKEEEEEEEEEVMAVPRPGLMEPI